MHTPPGPLRKILFCCNQHNHARAGYRRNDGGVQRHRCGAAAASALSRSGRLVFVMEDLRERNVKGFPFSAADFFDLRNGTKNCFEDFAAVDTQRQVITREDGTPEQVGLAEVTCFAVMAGMASAALFGVVPAIGAARPDVINVLRASDRTADGGRRMVAQRRRDRVSCTLFCVPQTRLKATARGGRPCLRGAGGKGSFFVRYCTTRN